MYGVACRWDCVVSSLKARREHVAQYRTRSICGVEVSTSQRRYERGRLNLRGSNENVGVVDSSVFFRVRKFKTHCDDSEEGHSILVLGA